MSFLLTYGSMGGSLMHLMLRLKGMRRFCLYIAQIVPPARRGALKDTPRHRGQHPGHGPVRQHFGKGRFRTPQKLATMGTVVTDAAPPLLCPGLFSIFLSRLCLPLSPQKSLPALGSLPQYPSVRRARHRPEPEKGPLPRPQEAPQTAWISLCSSYINLRKI